MSHADEEIGGADGMMKFIKDKEFKGMNIGFALDEGMLYLRTSPSPSLPLPPSASSPFPSPFSLPLFPLPLPLSLSLPPSLSLFLPPSPYEMKHFVCVFGVFTSVFFISGLANPTNAFTVFYSERLPWCKCTHLILYYCIPNIQVFHHWCYKLVLSWTHVSILITLFSSFIRVQLPFKNLIFPFILKGVKVTCRGNTGHGSRFVENTAAAKLVRSILLTMLLL